MKSIFLLVLVFISVKSYSQYPVNQTLGSDSTRITSKGAFKSRMINWLFTDTLDANSQHIDEYPGAQIFTTSDNKLWLRSADTSAWLLSVGGGMDTVYVTDDLYVVIDHLGHQVIHRFHNDGLLSGGIVSWTGTGLTFAISPAIYYLNQIRYQTGADTITLDPSDPSLPRRDVFVVDTIPDVGFITGTAAADPVTPQEDPPSQIILAEILLNAGDLTPSNVVANKIYDENIEWTTSTTGTLTIDYDNLDNPYIGTKAIFVSEYNNNSKLRFTYAGTETVTAGQTLKIFFYSNGAFTNKLRFQFYNTNNSASNSLQINSGFGLNPLDSNNYQNISIPLSAFVFTSTTFNRLVITNVGNDTSGAKGYYLDNIQLQTGITNLPPPVDYSNKVDSVIITKTTVGSDTTNVFKQYVKGFAKTIGTVWTGGATPAVITANNGLTKTVNNIALGGTAFGANTSIPTSAFSLTLTSSNATKTLDVVNSDASANGIMASALAGTALYGAATTGFGVRGFATGAAGIGGFFEAGTGTSALGIQSKGTANYSAYLYRIAASENDVLGIVKVHRGGSTTGLGSNGIGGSIDYTAITSAGATQTANQFIWKWTDATNATRTSQFSITGVNSGTTGILLKGDGNGDITVTNLAGTGSRNVVADANGLLSAPVSDQRLKTNISPVSKWVDVLGLLKDENKRGVFYNWKDLKRGTAKEIGFVAQGFEDIKGMTGTMNNTGYKYLNYDRVAAILWEQNRLLLERIEALEKTLNDLLKK